jgi:hypothetical protein
MMQVTDIIEKWVGKTSHILIGTPLKVALLDKNNSTFKPLLEIVESLLTVFGKLEADRRKMGGHGELCGGNAEGRAVCRDRLSD